MLIESTKRRVQFVDKLKAIKNTIDFFLQLSFYSCSTSAPSLRLSMFDLLILDKLFNNFIILHDMVKPINDLNLQIVATWVLASQV